MSDFEAIKVCADRTYQTCVDNELQIRLCRADQSLKDLEWRLVKRTVALLLLDLCSGGWRLKYVDWAYSQIPD